MSTLNLNKNIYTHLF